MAINVHQRNAILWAIWGRGTNKLVWERPNGDWVDDQPERLRRSEKLAMPTGVFPEWAEYEARAEKVVTEQAVAAFGGTASEALLTLFSKLQKSPQDVSDIIGAAARHADLDYIVEAKVRPWLEAVTK